MVGIINKHNDILLKKHIKKTYITYQWSTEPLKGHFLMLIIKHPCFPLNYYLASHKYHLFENKYYLFNSCFISDKSPYYTGYINYNHRLLIIN